MISFTIESALQSKRLCRVIVSTDNTEIADYSRSLGAELPILRHPHLATDESPTLDAMLHAMKSCKGSGPGVDAVVLLQPTSLFRTADHIDQCIERFEETRADTFYGRKIVPFLMEPEFRLDIDTVEDLQWADYLFEQGKQK